MMLKWILVVIGLGCTILIVGFIRREYRSIKSYLAMRKFSKDVLSSGLVTPRRRWFDLGKKDNDQGRWAGNEDDDRREA